MHESVPLYGALSRERVPGWSEFYPPSRYVSSPSAALARRLYTCYANCSEYAAINIFYYVSPRTMKHRFVRSARRSVHARRNSATFRHLQRWTVTLFHVRGKLAFPPSVVEFRSNFSTLKTHFTLWDLIDLKVARLFFTALLFVLFQIENGKNGKGAQRNRDLLLVIQWNLFWHWKYTFHWGLPKWSKWPFRYSF